MGYREVVLADSPLHYWRLGGAGSDPSVVDEVVTAALPLTVFNSGSAANWDVRPGIDPGDNARRFGLEQDLAAAIGASTANQQMFNRATVTFEAWVYPAVSANAQGFRPVVGVYVDYLGNPGAERPALASDENGTYTFFAAGTTATFAQLRPWRWHHLVGVADGTDLVTYLNGVEMDRIAFTGNVAPALAATDILAIGSDLHESPRSGNESYASSLYLDEVAIYTSALSAARVQAHFAAAGPHVRYVEAVLADAPTRYYRFETSQLYTSVPDTSTLLNFDDATTDGTSFGGFNDPETPGVLPGSNALHFARTAPISDCHFVNTPIHDQPALTLEAWVYPTDSGGTQTLFWNGSQADPAIQGPLADLRLKLKGGGAGNEASFGAVPTNTWTHLAVTFAAGIARLYRNGQEVATLAYTGNVASTHSTSGADCYIGSANATAHPFKGRIDEFAVYSTALSAARILAHFEAAGVAPPSPPPTALVVPPPMAAIALPTRPIAAITL